MVHRTLRTPARRGRTIGAGPPGGLAIWVLCRRETGPRLAGASSAALERLVQYPDPGDPAPRAVPHPESLLAGAAHESQRWSGR